MSNYIGFFVRDQLGQVPNQTGTAWAVSPDIIMAGNQVPSSLSQYTSAAGYAQDFNANVAAGYPPSPNYLYLRTLNTNPAATPSTPITGRAWIYWVESDLALWPQNWRGDLITVNTVGQNYQDIVTAGLNEVDVTGQPFIWEPPAPNAGSHFCLISWIENQPVNPPSNPVANFPYMGTLEDLMNFVYANPNMGWRNTNDVTSLGYTWSQITQISGPTVPGQFNVGFQCANMPTDSQVGFTIPPPKNGGSGINYNMMTIPNANYQGTVKVTDWPGGAASTITLNYIQGTTQPAAGASITVTLTTPTSTLSESTRRRLAERPDLVMVHDVIEFDPLGTEIVMITPTEVALVGSQTYFW